MNDVSFYEIFELEERVLKKYLPEDIQCAFFRNTIQEEGQDSPSSRIVSIRTQSVIPDSWQDDLDGVLTRSRGYDHLSEFQERTSVMCGYLDEYCSRAVAEQAVMSMMCLLRKFKKQVKQFEGFNREGLTGHECYLKNVLVIGVGCIGNEIVGLVRGLSMSVRGVDLKEKVQGLEYVNLEEGLSWADVIFCALPLTKLTSGLLSESALSAVKQGAVLINVSRAEITPLDGLRKLLDKNHLSGICLDVFPQEEILAEQVRSAKDLTDDKHIMLMNLKNQDNVIFTPHNAFNTQEALEKKSQLTADAVIQFLKNKTFPLVVPAG